MERRQLLRWPEDHALAAAHHTEYIMALVIVRPGKDVGTREPEAQGCVVPGNGAS